MMEDTRKVPNLPFLIDENCNCNLAKHACDFYAYKFLFFACLGLSEETRFPSPCPATLINQVISLYGDLIKSLEPKIVVSLLLHGA